MAQPPPPSTRPGNAAQTSLRAMRDDLVADVLAGRLEVPDVPRQYSELADGWLIQQFARATKGKERGFALIAVGGYGRRQLCPGSDLDLVLLHRARGGYEKVAQAIWYAIWDDGTHLDHSVRTQGEALAVARADLKAVLGLLDGRHIAGDARLSERLFGEVRELWRKQRVPYLTDLERAAIARHRESGELAFLLEPDLKQSFGGLRDIAALRSLALAVQPVAEDATWDGLDSSERVILDARVVLHCRTGRDSDRLLLQEQDQVAEVLKFADADVLMGAIADAGRTVTAIWVDAWRRSRPLLGAAAANVPDIALGAGIVLRNGEIALAAGAEPANDPTLLVRLAAAAAQRMALIERETLDRLEREAPSPPTPWDHTVRNAFISLLGTGDALIPVAEALDQRRLFERLLPEWSAVRHRPQRNAYHRFTVDRHLLEAVARASEHVHDVDRPDLLLVGALLHDIGKGYEGDHCVVGEELAASVARRMGYGEQDVAILARLVAYHLVIPECATRRDLDDPSTARLVARVAEDRRTLGLLTALTQADSRATGPSAWSPWKAELVAKLAERAGQVLEGVRLSQPEPYAPSEDQRELIAGGKLALRASGKRVTVVAPDRPGLLAAAAGALALHKCNVRRATAASAEPGMAVEVFDVEPQFDRLPDWAEVERDVAAVLDGSLVITDQLAERDRTYAQWRRPVSAEPPQQHVKIDNDTSDLASIVEVRTADRLGLLHEITAALAGSGCDVEAALVDTLGHEVIDTFYVRDGTGQKLSSGAVLQNVRNALNLVLAPEPNHATEVKDS